MSKSFRAYLFASAASLGALAATPSLALEEFEIEEPEVEKGEVELQYVGHQFWGFPKRRFVVTDDDPDDFEFELDDNELTRKRHYFEFGMGLSDWLGFAIAAEFEEERKEDVRPGLAGFEERDDFGTLKFSDIEGEFKVVAVPLKGNGLGLTLFAEVGSASEQEEGNVFGFGPIIKAVQGPFSVTVNPVFTKHFSGKDEFEIEDGEEVLEQRFDDRWDFNYGWQFAYQMNDKISLSIEGYGTVDRLGNSGVSRPEEGVIAEIIEAGGSPGNLFRDHDQHFAGPVVYYKIGGENEAASGDDDDKGGEEKEAPTLTLGIGVLFGLNEDAPDTALKWSMEAEF